jgi:D-amino-acid dehydrogenase
MSGQVVILGGGVIGLCTAWFCRQRGFDVTLIEADGPDRNGCSFGNAGMIVPSHVVPLAAPGMIRQGLKWLWNRESPFAIRPRLNLGLLRWGLEFWKASAPGRVDAAAPLLARLHLASRQLFEELERDPGMDFGLVRRGLLMLCRTREALEAEAQLAQRARHLGMPAEILNAGQIRALDPEIAIDAHGAVLFPQDCHLVPEHFMAGLQQGLQQRAVRCLWHTRAIGWRSEGQRLLAVQTSEGPVGGEHFVLCGGMASTTLARALGLRLPLQPGKGYSLTLAQPRQLPRLCSLLIEARVAVTPMGSSLRVGGTLELGANDFSIDARRVRGIVRSFCDYYRAFQPEDFAGLNVWTGLRPVPPDGLPYLGRSRRVPNLLVAAGHSMMGLSLGPVTGQIIAGLICGEAPAFDLHLLDVERFR